MTTNLISPRQTSLPPDGVPATFSRELVIHKGFFLYVLSGRPFARVEMLVLLAEPMSRWVPSRRSFHHEPRFSLAVATFSIPSPSLTHLTSTVH